MKKHICVLDEAGYFGNYQSLAAFLVTLTSAELTTALATVLEIDRELLTVEIMRLQAEALIEGVFDEK